MFILGSDPTYGEPVYDESDDGVIDDETYDSKDAKVAKIYQDKVYYPLIEDIHKNYYMMPEPKYDEEITAAYTVVSWMDS